MIQAQLRAANHCEIPDHHWLYHIPIHVVAACSPGRSKSKINNLGISSFLAKR